jgi:hypothetical protein
MIETLKRICELQRQYSHKKTPAMAERGRLLREGLRMAIVTRLPEIASAMGGMAADLRVQAHDGIGHKSAAPTVRVFSQSLSPHPRDGYSFVVHFAFDGSAVYFTISHGISVWSDGNNRPSTEDELKRQKEWAEEVIKERWGTLEPFTDRMALGAPGTLAQSFDRATVLARRIPEGQLDAVDVYALLLAQCERLGEIYRCQLQLRDVSPADQVEREVFRTLNPLRGGQRGQGFGLTADQRKAVEMRAMSLAIEHLEGEGYACEDVSMKRGHSCDLIAKKGETSVKVEVKGTTSDFGHEFVMTTREVELHQKEKGTTCLIVVSQIRLESVGGVDRAEGGVLEAHLPWDIGEWDASPLNYRMSRSHRGG